MLFYPELIDDINKYNNLGKILTEQNEINDYTNNLPYDIDYMIIYKVINLIINNFI